MSLDTNVLIFAGHQQGDVASLQADGEFYYCYTYLNITSWTVEAVVTVAQPHGEVVLFHSIIDAASNAEITNTAGRPLDCPKVLASGTRFVVHWLAAATVSEGFRQWELFRSSMDMTAFDEEISGWTAHGSVGLFDRYALYDAQPVIGHDDFIVARATGTTPDEITVERFDTAAGYSWLDQAWTTQIERQIAGHVLAVYAHEDDNDVLITYETEDDGIDLPNDFELWTAHLDANDGSNLLEVQTFTTYASADGAHYVQVGHCRTQGSTVAIFAEAQSDFAENDPRFEWLHHTAFRLVNSSTAARIGTEHATPHLHMVSRPWAYADGTSLTSVLTNVYCACSYKSAYQTNDWEQAYIYVLNFNLAMWELGALMAVQPRPILTVTSGGTPDARASGWHPEDQDVHVGGPSKRINHVSSVAGAPPSGADVKTRTVAIGMFARTAAIGVDSAGGADYDVSEVQPENCGIRGLRVYMEDPQTVYRDPSLPTQPVDNFYGAYSRTMGQAIETGRSLFYSGGTPYVYDGRQVVESGFPWKPEILAVAGSTTTPTSGGLDPNTTYQYLAVYEWIDNAGQIHRSGPSRIVDAETDGDDDTMTLYLRTLPISLKDNDILHTLAESIEIVIYRNAPTDGAGGTKFYRLFGGTIADERARDGPINDLPAATLGLYLGVVDVVSDARLVFHDPAPDALQYAGADPSAGLTGPRAITVPAFTAIAAWQNRVYGADAIDPTLIWPSDEIAVDETNAAYQAPVFSFGNQFRVGEIGDVIAMHPLNNYLIVFTASDIYAIGGVPGSHTIERLHRGTGCIEPRSVVQGPPGIFFQAGKGYHLLNEGRQLEFDVIGAQVIEEFTEAGNIHSASISESDSKIKLVCNGRPVTTYTTTWTAVPGLDPTGTWSITLVGFDGVEEIASVESDAELTGGQLANLLALDIFNLIEDETLDGIIVSVAVNDDEIIVEWAPDVVPNYIAASPGGTSLNGVDESEMETFPRVLVFNYFTRTWSRADLVQSSTSVRLSETAGGCMWRGLQDAHAHVVLTQGAILIERGPTDALAFADQTHNETVGIPIDVQTNWLTFNTIAGWCRVYTIDIQGEKPNATAVSVDVETDVSGDHSEPEFDTYAWASPAPFAGRIRPRIQQCSGVRVRIYEDPEVAALENIALTALIFDLGIHKKGRRQSDAQTGT